MNEPDYHWAVDDEEQAELAVAELIGFRVNPQRGDAPAISMLRSRYRQSALEIAAVAHAEKTREQLDVLSLSEVPQVLEFIAFCAGYLAARMFLPAIGPDAVLSRLVLPDTQSLPEDMRKASLERAKQYLPALSEIHDNRAAPRDSRMVHAFLAKYLGVLVEDPRQTTLDTLLAGYEEPDLRRGVSGFSARQIAEALDTSRLWATLGWRRGMAERRFRPGPRGVYYENFAGDVRILFDREPGRIGFADVRRVRRLDAARLQDPHPCDDVFVADWIAGNIILARQGLAAGV